MWGENNREIWWLTDSEDEKYQFHDFSSGSGSSYASIESEEASDAEDNGPNLEAEFEAAKRFFNDKKNSLREKIRTFDTLISLPQFQKQSESELQPNYVTGAYYFKALAHSRIGTPVALTHALDALSTITYPSLAHQILKAECLEKQNKIEEAKEIFKAVERELLKHSSSKPSYEMNKKRVYHFNIRHDLPNESTGLTAKEEAEGFRVKAYTPFNNFKKEQVKTVLKTTEDDRYTVSVSNQFSLLRNMP